MAYYLKVDGLIFTSDNPQYPHWLELQTYGFTGSGPGASINPSNPASSLGDLLFVFERGEASSQLHHAAHEGRHFKSAILVVVKDGPRFAKQSENFRLIFTDVMVSSYQNGHHAGTTGDQASFNFSKTDRFYGVSPGSNETIRPEHQHLFRT